MINRGLHIKLVSIMLLLITSLMVVVCSFLVLGSQNFYQGEFYSQMQYVFADSVLSNDLRLAAKENQPEKMAEILSIYSGRLGIDSATRNYYILDGKTAEVLAGSSSDTPEVSANILSALNGQDGFENDRASEYMDVALTVGNGSFIIYIRDNKETVRSLNMELFMIIMESLFIGLIISVFLSLLLSKTLVNPIQKLTSAAERVAGGDFSESIEVSANDEIGVLTNTFNEMATKLHDTMEEIENERNKLSTVFLHMTDGVAAFSNDGELIHLNPAAQRFLELPEGSLTFEKVFGDVADMEEIRRLREPGYKEVEKSIKGRELEIFFASFSSEDALGGVLAVVHDVTQQKKEEDMRREFVANVSHELRTPITGIRTYAETLVDTPDIPDEMRENFLKVILNESDRMTVIVQDLLALSKFDAGSEELSLKKFSFDGAVKSVYDAMALEAKKHGFDMQLLLGGVPEIMGDRARIEQVIMNIVSNALRYTPDGGSVYIKTWQDGENVSVSVKDTGIGIPQEDIPRIFERFYRVDKARSRAMGGSGLGLSIANEIVKRHNGSISIKSAVGEGTEVCVMLPIQQEESV